MVRLSLSANMMLDAAWERAYRDCETASTREELASARYRLTELTKLMDVLAMEQAGGSHPNAARVVREVEEVLG